MSNTNEAKSESRTVLVTGARPLRGELAGHYRMRTGDYRVQFRLEGQTIVIEQLGHRDGFYER